MTRLCGSVAVGVETWVYAPNCTDPGNAVTCKRTASTPATPYHMIASTATKALGVGSCTGSGTDWLHLARAGDIQRSALAIVH